MYKLCQTINGVTPITRLSDMSVIPQDPANTDAIEFCKWLKDGNVPEPAVEGETVSAEWISETIAKLTKE